MYRFVGKLLLCGIISVSALTGTALAQSGPGGFGTPPAPAPNQMTKLDNQSLPQMLQAAGYQVQNLTFTNGQPYWKVSTQLNGWSYVVEVRPYYTNGQISGFWLMSDLNGQTPAGSMSSQALLKLLETNKTIAPYFFSYTTATSKLCLQFEHPYGNSNVQEIRTLVTNFCNKARDTYSLWNGTGGQTFGQTNNNQFQPPVNANQGFNASVVNLAGTTWNGQENITGSWTTVTLRFLAGGQATMTTPRENFTGTWTQNGSQVTVSFPTVNTTLQGTINGKVLSGQGKDNIGPWSFNVTMQ